MAKHTKIVKKTKPIRRPPPEKDYRPMISKENFAATKDKNVQKWKIYHDAVRAQTPTSTRRSSESSNVTIGTSDTITNKMEIQRQVLAVATQVCFSAICLHFFAMKNIFAFFLGKSF